MKIQNPPSVTLPPVHPALTGSPLLSEEVFFMEEIWKEIKDYLLKFKSKKNGYIV